MNKFFFAATLLFFLLFFFFPTVSSGEVIPFDSDRWVFQAKEHRIESHNGKKLLYLKGGIAYLKDTDFRDGIIEFDISIPEAFGFMGAIWRVQDPENYEEFYLRSSRSGQPDANQYTPVFNGLSAWQLYHGKGFSAPTVYRFETWMHVKIVVSGKRAAVYIIDMDRPALVIDEMKREIADGAVGLKVTDFAPGRFANFKLSKTPEPIPAAETAADRLPAAAGTVLNYRVSDPFDEKLLAKSISLDPSFIDERQWQNLETEKNGLANLARTAKISQGNTVLARVLVDSEKDQIKKMQFGYSDRIIVYLNKRPLYGGTNVWRSRDFRYLGTIGYFDEVYLHLRRGENEIIMAVSENFGGWGLQTRFADTAGIRIR